jgi:hypothetical protein
VSAEGRDRGEMTEIIIIIRGMSTDI